MYLFAMAASSMLVLSMVLTIGSSQSISHDEQLRHHIDESDRYKMFAFSASQRMGELSPPSSGVRVLRWDDLKQAGVLPDGMKNVDLRSDWKVVQTPDDWVICAPMNEASYNRISVNVRETGTIERNSYMVMGETNESEATDYASLCASYR